MDAIPNDCILTVPRATARIAAFLQVGRAQGAIIHCKYAVVLFGGRARDRRSEDGAFSPSWRLLWCTRRPQAKVSKLRRGPPRWPPARFTAFLRCPVTTSMSAANVQKELLICFPTILKSRGCYEEGRQHDSVHIYSVPWPLR